MIADQLEWGAKFASRTHRQPPHGCPEPAVDQCSFCLTLPDTYAIVRRAVRGGYRESKLQGGPAILPVDRIILFIDSDIKHRDNPTVLLAYQGV
jgi:hypothetical protein